MIIHLEIMAMTDTAIQELKVHIAGEECRVKKFFGEFIQCEKCQGFDHTRIHCKREARCGICVQDRVCSHTRSACVNWNYPIKPPQKSVVNESEVDQGYFIRIIRNLISHLINRMMIDDLDSQSDNTVR